MSRGRRGSRRRIMPGWLVASGKSLNRRLRLHLPPLATASGCLRGRRRGGASPEWAGGGSRQRRNRHRGTGEGGDLTVDIENTSIQGWALRPDVAPDPKAG
jgi:hypothetical protein